MMGKLLYDAWSGWQDYVYHGKYAALLFLVLLVYWFAGERFLGVFPPRGKTPEAVPGEEARPEKIFGETHRLMRYTTLAAICCILPPTAAILMKYQTRFYDYQWIWSVVPLTIVVALGAALFLGKMGEQAEKADGVAGKRKLLAATLGMVLLVGLCGLIHAPVFDADRERAQQKDATVVLEELASVYAQKEEEIYLWAPQEIMAAARATRPEIKLIYGRDMWDLALRAYAYGTYSEALEDNYHWMNYTDRFGTFDGFRPEGTPLKGEVCVDTALAEGANCILLPGSLQEEALTEMETLLGCEARTVEGYYLFVL